MLFKINKVGWVLWKEVVEIEQKWFYSNTDTIQPSVNSRYCKTNMKKDNITVKGFFVLMDISIHLLLLFIFVCWFGTPIISDFTNYSTVFTEETIKYNGLPGISFVSLIAGSSVLNHGWNVDGNLHVNEMTILTDVCRRAYSNFTSTYREFVDCIDEQSFSVDELIPSWNNGKRLAARPKCCCLFAT